jgi:hypothetical protein
MEAADTAMMQILLLRGGRMRTRQVRGQLRKLLSVHRVWVSAGSSMMEWLAWQRRRGSAMM